MYDTLRLATKDPKKLIEVEEFGIFENINVNRNESALILVSKIFYKIQKNKCEGIITNSKFRRLSKLPGMVSKTFLDVDYDILYKIIINKSLFYSMDFFGLL